MKKLPDIEAGASGNRSVMVVGDPFAFVNSLTQSPSKSALYNMSNAEISALQPMIRLFKVVKQESINPFCPMEKEIEIKFNANAPSNIEDMLKRNRGIRSPGVGLKSFNFAYEGSNPFSVKKSISAKLVIHANSFSELLEPKNEGTEDEYRYVDLALKTGNTETFRLNRQLSDVQLDNLEKLNFRLKAVVGWQNPRFTSNIFDNNPGVIDAINNSAISLNLTPTVHDFSIDDIGRVTFTINFLAYSEDYFDNSYYDIFTDTTVVKDRLIRNLKIKKQNNCDGTAQAELDKKDDELEKKIREEKQKALRGLFSSLVRKKKVYFMGIHPKDLYLYSSGGPYGRAAALYSDNLESKIKSGFDSRDDQLAAGTVATQHVVPEDDDDDPVSTPLQSTISFFYAGDLIDSILEDIGKSIDSLKNDVLPTIEIKDKDVLTDALGASYAATFRRLSPQPGHDIELDDLVAEIEKYYRLSDNYKKLRILLGPAEIVASNSYESEIINLGDIPISFKHFMEWLTTKMLKKEQATYSLPSFLNDFFNTYITDYMNSDSCYNSRAKQRISLFQNAFTEYRNSTEEQDTITKKCKALGARRLEIDSLKANLPILNIMGVRDDPRTNTGVCTEINYMSYYAGRVTPSGVMTGDKASDEASGIWHHQIGRNVGIVKSINLSKTDSTGLAEVRFEQDGYDGLRQLRVVYDTTMKTYLDIGAFPGVYIYVEPKGFDPSGRYSDTIKLDELGIGGYCMIWKSEHMIQPGLAESTIHAKWVASTDNEPSEGEAAAEQQKCSST